MTESFCDFGTSFPFCVFLMSHSKIDSLKNGLGTENVKPTVTDACHGLVVNLYSDQSGS